MHKKISAAFILMLFALSVVSLPVQAHFTLGTYKGTYDYHDLDYDGETADSLTAHIPGLTAYVFPGAGPLSSPIPGYSPYPGYQSLYPGGNPPAMVQNWYQADANSYGPFGAILTSTIKAGTAFNKLFHNEHDTIWGPRDNEVDALPIEHEVRGDLVFAINYTLPWVEGPDSERYYPDPGYAFDRVEVWIPPEFQGVKKENIVASFTNDWGNLGSTYKTDLEEAIHPNRWTRIRVDTDKVLDGLTTGRYLIFGNSSYGDTWAIIRVNNVIAPTIAGKYFFKIALRVRTSAGAGFGAGVVNDDVNNGNMIWLGSPAKPYGTFLSNGVPNFPVLLVKGEVDPAYVDGTVRYGGYAGPSYYGQPLQLAGRVRLVGRAIDPWTLQPTARPVEARGYFNSTAVGHFEVEGVAPGIYDIYASAAGYPEKLIQSQITILKGQSYHIDCYLTPGVVIEGEVFSKCGTGEVPWVTWQNYPGDGYTAQDIKIEIYKVGSVPTATGATCSVTAEALEGITCASPTTAVSWSPVSTSAAGWGVVPIGFPWPGYGGKYANGFDTNGVGPEQQWQVVNTQGNFRFQFGDKGLYGTPTLFSGHVPQLNATWIDGLPAGSYEVRAFTYGYVQTKADGVTFEHVTFTVPAVEWPGDIYIPFDLRLSNYVKKTAHFHDVPGTLEEKPIPGSIAHKDNRNLYLEVVDGAGAIWGWKVDSIQAGRTSATIYSRGIRAQSMNYWGDDSGRNYGFHSQTYTLRAYMYGYVEQVFEKVTVGLCGSEIAISDHLYRGVLFNVTFYSMDWEHPTVNKPWKYPDEYIYLQIWKDGKQLTGYGYGPNKGRDGGGEYYVPAGNTYDHDGSSQPFGVDGLVVSSYRVQQGNTIYKKVPSVYTGWTDTSIPAPEKTFVSLYYEGQEAETAKDAAPGNYPTSFESGLYEFVGLTYGYVMQMDPVTRQAKRFQVYATKGGVANIPIKLVVGVQIPLIIRFKHEMIFEHLRYNSTVRVRVFDDQNMLVGEWFTSSSINGTSSPLNGVFEGPMHTGDVIKGLPEGILPADPSAVRTILGPGYTSTLAHLIAVTGDGEMDGYETTNYVPRSVEMLNLTICGLPDPYASGSGAYYAPNGFDRVFNVAPFVPGLYGAPGAPYGISGHPWYTGGFWVEVEVVPFGNEDNKFYPFVPGVLYGESCTIDPRTGKLYDWAIGANHVGPYQQRVHVTLPGAHLGGESSAIFELDLLGLAKGIVYSYTWCDDWRTTSWVPVLFSGAAGSFTYPTWDGVYEAYLPAGTWQMDVIPWTAAGQGYTPQSMTLAVSDGQVGGYTVYLEESGIPIPEFPTTLVVLASALAASLAILRRRRK